MLVSLLCDKHVPLFHRPRKSGRAEGMSGDDLVAGEGEAAPEKADEPVPKEEKPKGERGREAGRISN